MHLRFNFKRTLQAVRYLLRLDGKRMPYLRLLKLLHIADRQWLAETCESITGDRACAMKQWRFEPDPLARHALGPKQAGHDRCRRA